MPLRSPTAPLKLVGFYPCNSLKGEPLAGEPLVAISINYFVHGPEVCFLIQRVKDVQSFISPTKI